MWMDYLDILCKRGLNGTAAKIYNMTQKIPQTNDKLFHDLLRSNVYPDQQLIDFLLTNPCPDNLQYEYSYNRDFKPKGWIPAQSSFAPAFDIYQLTYEDAPNLSLHMYNTTRDLQVWGVRDWDENDEDD